MYKRWQYAFLFHWRPDIKFAEISEALVKIDWSTTACQNFQAGWECYAKYQSRQALRSAADTCENPLRLQRDLQGH